MEEHSGKEPFTPSFLNPQGEVRPPFVDGSNPGIEEITKAVPLIRTEDQLKRARKMIEDGKAENLADAAEKLFILDANRLGEDRSESHSP